MNRRSTSTDHSPRGRCASGFTLLEIQIVLSVVAIIATIIIPNLVASRLATNEAAAIATLRTLVTAQAQLREASKVDTDADGTGEYGGFAELSGAKQGRMAAPLAPPVLSGGFRFLNFDGEVTRNGYLFKIFLPGPGGVGIGEPFGGFLDVSGVAGEFAETTWCCYAWPVNYDQSGHRTFFVNQGGDTLAAEDGAYSGRGNGPSPDAAFLAAGTITGALAVSAPGQDGNTWKSAK